MPLRRIDPNGGPQRELDVVHSLPNVRAVFLLRLAGEGPPYLGRTARLRDKLQRLLTPEPAVAAQPAATRPAISLAGLVREIHYWPAGSDFEAQWLFARLVRRLHPGDYRRRLGWRTPLMIRVQLANRYPRVYVRRGLAAPPSWTFGPFPARRGAESFCSDLLDLFQLRRCTQDLNPDPSFPGCIYSEMKMCLAPCFQGCTEARYQQEVGRVEQALVTRGESLRTKLEQEREAASADMRFEKAQRLHQKLQKLQQALRLAPSWAMRTDRFRAVVVQPGLPEAGPRAGMPLTLIPVFGGLMLPARRWRLPVAGGIAAEAVRPPVAAPCEAARPLAATPDEVATPGEAPGESLDKTMPAPAAPPAVHASSLAAGETQTSPRAKEAVTTAALLAALEGALRLPVSVAGERRRLNDDWTLLARWLFRRKRLGEIVFWDAEAPVPWRRLLNACQRVARGEAEDEA